MSNLHEGHRKRMRDRFFHQGMEGFSEHEKLEFILSYSIPRKDVNELAHQLIEKFGSFNGVICAEPVELMEIKGVGEYSTALLTFMGQCARLFRPEDPSGRINMESARLAVDYLVRFMTGVTNECVYCFALDSRYRLIKPIQIASGNARSALMSPREITMKILSSGAAAAVFAHNHPAGTLTPSEADEKVTEMLHDICRQVQVRFLEHYVVTYEGIYAIEDKKPYFCDPIKDALVAAEKPDGKG